MHTCNFCDKSFNASEYEIARGQGKYCSLPCSQNSKIKRIARTCEFCQKEFIVKPSSPKKYCNRTCIVGARRARRLTALCMRCGEKFFPRQNIGKYGKYCSRECVIGHPYYPLTCWIVWDNLSAGLKQLIKNDVFPTRQLIKKTMGQGAIKAINHFGGIKAVGEKLGCDMTRSFIISSDGHYMRSSYEFLFDEFLYSRGIPHEVGEKIPGSNYRYDFKIDDHYIEIWGFDKKSGSSAINWKNRYLISRKKKEIHYKNSNLKLISIEAAVFNQPMDKIEAFFVTTFDKLGYDVTIKIKDFNFSSLTRHYALWTEEDVISILAHLNKKYGRIPTREELTATGRGDIIYAIKKHGGFNKFKKILHGGKCWKWTKKKVENYLYQQVLQTGAFPAERQLPTGLMSAIYIHGDSLTKHQLNIEKNMGCRFTNKLNWSEESITDALACLQETFGYFPSISQIPRTIIAAIYNRKGRLKTYKERLEPLLNRRF